MTGPRNYNSPLPAGKLCNADGTPTAQFQAFIRSIWERTGRSLGSDASWTAGEAANATSTANDVQILTVLNTGLSALSRAQEALDAAQMALLQAQATEARTLKLLENVQELATLLITARGNAQAAQSQNENESMTFSVMNRQWPSSHKTS